MKKRPYSSTSERELVRALAEGDRDVSLAKLANWRKEGLLPPLASHGLGTGKGKAYYWHEPNILDHACTTHDLLQRYRPETVIWLLWLSGFDVSLSQLRRVGASRAKAKTMWKARPSAITEVPQTARNERFTGHNLPANHVLMYVLIELGAAFLPDRSDTAIVNLVNRAVGRFMGRNFNVESTPDPMGERFWLIVRVLTSALEKSDIVSTASNEELRDAQRFLSLAGGLLRPCSKEEDYCHGAWPLWMADGLGAPLFVLILALLRSGNRTILEQTISTWNDGSRRRVAPPALQPSSAA